MEPVRCSTLLMRTKFRGREGGRERRRVRTGMFANTQVNYRKNWSMSRHQEAE